MQHSIQNSASDWFDVVSRQQPMCSHSLSDRLAAYTCIHMDMHGMLMHHSNPPRSNVLALQAPPRFCVACRGEHEPVHEHNPRWQPYTPLQRFTNLNMLETNFQRAFR